MVATLVAPDVRSSKRTEPIAPLFHVKDAWVPERLAWGLKEWKPKSEMGKIVRECLHYLPATLAADLLDRVTRTLVLESSLGLTHLHGAYQTEDGLWTGRAIDEYGIVSRKVITNAGVAFLVDAWQNIVELEIMKYHALGTGGTAEAVGDTALVTECTTAYNPDNTRATGTLAETSAPVFSTVGTNTVDAAVAATEHGIFSVSTSGSGVLWDRSLFTVVNLASGDGLTSSYSMTASAGG